jgi:hypothetical protein
MWSPIVRHLSYRENVAAFICTLKKGDTLPGKDDRKATVMTVTQGYAENL